MKQFLDKLKNKQDLTFEESKSAFELLMTGKATDDEIYNFLTLLSNKGEVSDEIAGGVYVLREKINKFISRRKSFICCTPPVKVPDYYIF